MMQEFVMWLPTKYEEFQDKEPEEVVAMVQQIAESGEEGQAMIQQMMQEFQAETSGDNKGQAPAFRKGGKIDFLVQKMANGGRTVGFCRCGAPKVIRGVGNGRLDKVCVRGCKN